MATFGISGGAGDFVQGFRAGEQDSQRRSALKLKKERDEYTMERQKADAAYQDEQRDRERERWQWEQSDRPGEERRKYIDSQLKEFEFEQAKLFRKRKLEGGSAELDKKIMDNEMGQLLGMYNLYKLNPKDAAYAINKAISNNVTNAADVVPGERDGKPTIRVVDAEGNTVAYTLNGQRFPMEYYVGELEKLSTEAAKKKGGGSGRTTSEIQLIEYLTSSGIAPDRQTAFAMTRMARSDPTSAITRIAQMLQRNDEINANELSSADNYIQRAEGIVQQLRGNSLRSMGLQGNRGGASGASAPAAGLQRQGAISMPGQSAGLQRPQLPANQAISPEISQAQPSMPPSTTEMRQATDRSEAQRLVEEANYAISRGADPALVKARLLEMGIEVE